MFCHTLYAYHCIIIIATQHFKNLGIIMRNYAKYPTIAAFLSKGMGKYGTPNKRVLTEFLLQEREVSYEYHKYHFCLPLEARQT